MPYNPYDEFTLKVMREVKKAKSKEEKHQILNGYSKNQLLSLYNKLTFVGMQRTALTKDGFNALCSILKEKGIDLKKHKNPKLNGRSITLLHHVSSIVAAALGGLFMAVIEMYTPIISKEEVFGVIFALFFILSLGITFNPQRNVFVQVFLFALYIVILLTSYELLKF